jgi:hypothetical protein
MAWRFYRRVSLIPGLRANLSKSGVSLSIGHRGLWYTLGPHRRRVTVGLPGSGLYWTKSERYPPHPAPHAGHRAAAERLRSVEPIPPADPPHAGHRLLFAIAVFAALVAIYAAVVQAVH